MAKRKRENGTSSSKNSKPKSGEATPGKKLIINAFVEMCKFGRVTCFDAPAADHWGSLQAAAISRLDFGDIQMTIRTSSMM
jgi:hypothetical protein